jgi:hypothetical protein
MSAEKKPGAPAGEEEIREVRFSLSALLKEVARERLTGAFGAEKLHQKDIRTVFRPRKRNRREA